MSTQMQKNVCLMLGCASVSNLAGSASTTSEFGFYLGLAAGIAGLVTAALGYLRARQPA